MFNNCSCALVLRTLNMRVCCIVFEENAREPAFWSKFGKIKSSFLLRFLKIRRNQYFSETLFCTLFTFNWKVLGSLCKGLLIRILEKNTL